ncbi:MAG: dTMP kinase [Planctomycetes bacterium]|nr:dTMP kinase [Planctomycetota bacterium]
MGSNWWDRLRGKFLAFEGADGSGKSTQIARLERFCRDKNLKMLTVREPGGTVIGERIRDVLLDPRHTEMDVRSEMLLYMASRAQLVRECIEPALRKGIFVLSDRFVASTLAYQGTAGGLPPHEIRAVAEVAISGRWPDLNVLFDVDTAVAMSRLSPLMDRMEGKGAQFHARVRQGYLRQVQQNPKDFLVVDAGRSPDEVYAQLMDGLERWCATTVAVAP